MFENATCSTTSGRSKTAYVEPIGILYVSPLPPPEGGISVWTATLMRRGLPPPFKSWVVNTGLRQREIDRPTRLSFTEIRRSVSILCDLYRQIQSRNPAIVHINCSLSPVGVFRDWICALIARSQHVPYLVHLRGNLVVPDSTGLKARATRWVYRSMLRGASAILTLNKSSYSAVLQLGDLAHKVATLPNFVDSSTPTTDVDCADKNRPLQVAYVGSLSQQKGLLTILCVAQNVERVEFRLVGEPRMGDCQHVEVCPYVALHLERLLVERGIQDKVKLEGPLANNEARAVLREADVYIFPSVTEGFPISVAEAMVAGLPVIASNVGAIPDMIDTPLGGYIIPWDDTEAYTKALVRLRDDAELRSKMGLHNQQKAKQEYDFPKVIVQLCDVYYRILERI